MRLYALVEAGEPETIELFLTDEEAQRAPEGCLRDQPEWRGLLIPHPPRATLDTVSGPSRARGARERQEPPAEDRTQTVGDV